MIAERLTPLTTIILLVFFAIAVGAIVMQVSGASIETSSEQSLCDPLAALKMKLINKEITPAEFDIMKEKIGGP